ncbi:hypothetical protein [Sagittula sp. SSi028]|uniref:hypothetical protein n=1 Tax=Sagittula sp. SSi028 TaxID=3400636 RepID=UPI003AF6FF57
MMKDTGRTHFCPELCKSILQEFLRAELIRLIKFEEQIARQEEEALEARLDALEAENRQLRAAARKGDWTVLQEPLEQAAALMKAEEADSAVPALGRKAAALKRQVNDVEAIAFFGDVPITAVTKERQREFFAWMSRLPKIHGKGHGRNRYTSKSRAQTRKMLRSSRRCGAPPKFRAQKSALCWLRSSHRV